MPYHLHIAIHFNETNKNLCTHWMTFLVFLTSSICISQLLADHSSISVVPGVITHCSPLVIDAHLHSAFILIGASHQTNISISTVTTGVVCNKEAFILQELFYIPRFFVLIYLDTSLQHPQSDHSNSWQKSCLDNQWGYSHYHCIQHCPDRLDQHQHQSEHCRRPLHLIGTKVLTHTKIFAKYV